MINTESSNRNPMTLIWVAAIIFLVLSYLGGVPDASKVSGFVIGITTLIAGGIIVVAITWYLLIKPLPEGYSTKRENILNPVTERWLSAVMAAFAAFIAIGAVWDEAWHGRYGIPFGEDFLWRPHQLIYMGFGLIILTAAYALYKIMFSGKGNFQQRFRLDPMIGLFVITGMILVYAVPTDPFWHSVYGEGLSALSIPHALIAVPNTMISLIAINLIFSNEAKRSWASILQFKPSDLIPLLVFAPLTLNLMLLFTTDWHALGNPNIIGIPDVAYARPDWTLMLLVAFHGSWIGTMVVFATRRYGMATLTGLTSMGIRYILVLAVDNPASNLNPWLITLPIMLGVDVAAWYFSRKQEPIAWWKIALVGAVFQSLFVLPFFNQLFIHPVISPSNSIFQIIAIVVGSLIGSWMGLLIGNYIGNENKRENIVPSNYWEIPVVAIASVIFIIFWISTSTPPA